MGVRPSYSYAYGFDFLRCIQDVDTDCLIGQALVLRAPSFAL